jgi:DNA repair exonuclease SbcCD nuclease subunit
MSVAVILGDIHLGKSLSIGKSGIGSTLNSRIADQLNLLEWTLEQAISHQASCIITTGDVFEDPRPGPTLISLFIHWLKKCTDNDIAVHICKGNHDIIRSGQHHMSAFDIISAADIENVFIYNDISTLDLPGVSFTILPFRDRRSFNTNLNSEAVKLVQDKVKYERLGLDDRNLNIMVGHFALVGSLPVGDEVDDMHNELFMPLNTFADYDYTFMGHIHKPQVMSKAPFISHIGSMDLSNFSENTHSKIIAIIDSSTSEVVKYLDLPTRPLKQITISVPSDVTDTTAFVINQLKAGEQDLSSAIVRMHVGYESPDLISIDRPRVEEAVMGMGAFHIPRIDQERKVVQVKKAAGMENMDNTVNEATAIKMYATENVEEGFRNDFISLAYSIVAEAKETNAAS